MVTNSTNNVHSKCVTAKGNKESLYYLYVAKMALAVSLTDRLLFIVYQLQAYVTVHAYKQLWMYPWGYKKGNIESRANAETAQAAVEAINSYVHANQ